MVFVDFKFTIPSQYYVDSNTKTQLPQSSQQELF